MYRTCIHCHADLGANDALEEFPVGRRLAFDPAQGRLWVVCGGCRRWNLTPIESRWEAIEAADRRFHDTRLRYSTDNIGLAKLKEGLELVRVGEARRPEMAAWRFGEVLRQRLRQQVALTAGFAAFVGAKIFFGPAIAATAGALGALGSLITLAPSVATLVHMHRRFGTDPATGRPIRRRHLQWAALAPAEDPASGPWDLVVDTTAVYTRASGGEAMRFAKVALATRNQGGARERTIRDAVARLEAAGSADALTSSLLEPIRHSSGRFACRPLRQLDVPDRLALEMSLHEESEARALAGELVELELQWQEAERIAAIADDLLVPDWIREQLARLKPRPPA
jgi:hypothetical protein